MDFCWLYSWITFRLRTITLGIPGKCFSKATNEEADCSTDSRYVPAFSIPEDSDGYITINGTVKWVKWLERELRFQRDTAMTGTARITDRGIALGTLIIYQIQCLQQVETVKILPLQLVQIMLVLTQHFARIKRESFNNTWNLTRIDQKPIFSVDHTQIFW